MRRCEVKKETAAIIVSTACLFHLPATFNASKPALRNSRSVQTQARPKRRDVLLTNIGTRKCLVLCTQQFKFPRVSASEVDRVQRGVRRP